MLTLISNEDDDPDKILELPYASFEKLIIGANRTKFSNQQGDIHSTFCQSLTYVVMRLSELSKYGPFCYT